MKPTCTNCKFYSQPQHDSDITCAVNPEGKAPTCLHYTPIVEDNALEMALISLKRAEYEAFRQEALTRFGVIMPDANFNTNWLIPEKSISSIKKFLPKLLTHKKAQGYTQEQIIIAAIKWVEDRINYHLEECDLQRGLADYEIWRFLPSDEDE